ncbi:MAG: family transporter [Verrucomicrobiales bacterium]|nr:family transporter [Verrucomicrobiales bacterium]
MSSPPTTIAPSTRPPRSSSGRRGPLAGLLTAVLLIAVFYFGKPVLMPLALSLLLAFLLSPVVNLFHRWRLPRAVAVLLVTLFVFTLLGVMGWVIGREFSSLAASLPNYKDNIRSRIVSFQRTNQGGVMDKLQDIRTTIEETTANPPPPEADPNNPAAPNPDGTPATNPDGSPATAATTDKKRTSGSLSAPTPPPATTATSKAPPAKESSLSTTSTATKKPEPTADRPIPSQEPEQQSSILGGALGTVGEVLGNAATVIVFVIFMLLRQQELRNRVMRLAGFRHVTVVTRTMDETGERVGRYLLMQALINGMYGTVLAIGLYFIGLPYVVLFGVLAALFRFIPYIGPVAVAVLPSALSLAVFDDWQHPLMVMALIAGLELLTNMILEPVLYGQSVGVAEFPLLVSIVFWTWMWGGIGLVMATPLTVCFVVMARHIPALEWVEILMGDNPKVKTYMVLYQRLLAGDETEAEDYITTELKKKTPLEVVDETVLPAIALAKREYKQDRLTATEEQEMHDAVIRVMSATLPAPEVAEPPPEGTAPLLLGWALGGLADDAALRCFLHVLPAGMSFDTVPSQRLSSEFLTQVEARNPSAVLISATPPSSHDTARVQIRRLRRQFPRLKIFVGRWGVPADIAKASTLIDAGATAVYTGLSEARSALTAITREAAAIDEARPGPRPAASAPLEA